MVAAGSLELDSVNTETVVTGYFLTVLVRINPTQAQPSNVLY